MKDGDSELREEAALCALSVLRVSAVLRDCLDQLAVLGNIMSATHTDTNYAITAATMLSEDMSKVLGQQEGDELGLKSTRRGPVEGGGVSESAQEPHSKREKEQEGRLIDSEISDYMKIQMEWLLAARMISKVLTEVKKNGTFSSLIYRVQQDKTTDVNDMVIRDEADYLRMKKQLQDIQKETPLQFEERDKMAAHLEIQLQERKIKKRQQERYENKSAEVRIFEGQELNSCNEKQLEAEIKKLHQRLKDEERDHREMDIFLKNQQTWLMENLDYWMERYDNDMDDKEQNIITVKTSISDKKENLQDLANKYKDAELVIIEDRLEKENLRKQLEKEQLKWEAAIKIQSWWRGTVIRKGPFKKPKKPKPQKDKKGKKK